MASFPICPLIDQRCFLGVSDDSTPGCIIVSLGKKIIIRFRLSDQKQLSSWTTKDTLSSPVFYDADREEYFAFFNGELLSRWSKDKQFIHKKIRKYKFPWLIHSVHSVPGIRPVLLFKSGVLALLGTDDKKSITVLKNDVLQDNEVLDARAFSLPNSHYLCLTLKKDESLQFQFTPISESDDNAFSLDVLRKGSSSTLSCFTVIEEKGQLITLWSDGSLYSFDLVDCLRNVEEFPGRCVSTFTNINCGLPCVMLAIDNQVAVYGADANGEGAKVIWVEATFGVVQHSLHLKLYSNPPRMWKVGTSYLITPVGQNLTVIPYQLMNVPKLDSLLGAHCTTESKVTKIVWESTREPTTESSEQVQTTSEVSMKINAGYPESVLCHEVVSSLLEQGKVKEALFSMANMTDIPDKCIIDTVATCLKCKKSKHELLLQALLHPLLNDNITLSYVREKLPFESVVILLKTIADHLEKEPENESLVKWITLLLDSHFQHYLLTKDEDTVSQIVSLKQQVDNLISNMTEMQQLFKLLSGALKTKVSSKSSVQYSVDKFRLF